jgi:uncharacterized protein (TIGR00730 family)
MTVTKTVCVFCGSSTGSEEYRIAANRLGELLVQEDWGLVYGGGTTGLMGEVAKSVAGLGGRVLGIIPKALIFKEQSGSTPDEATYGKTQIVGDMHTRKRLMGQQSDAFVALPGGYGTAEELFEVITWNQLGIHSNPIIILNIGGFYDGLIGWIDRAVEEKFISSGNKTIVVAVQTPEEAIEAIKSYKVAPGRWKLNWDVQTPSLE